MIGLSPVLSLIILTNIIFSYIGFKDKLFFNRYKFNVLKLDNGDIMRMISSGFLHVDYNHLKNNLHQDLEKSQIHIFLNYI